MSSFVYNKPMEQIRSFIDDLGARFEGETHTDRVHRAIYSTDASIYQQAPMAVIVPRTMEALEAAVVTAIRYDLPITPRGSGSSLAGQAIGAGVIIDTTKYLNRIDPDFNPESGLICVEPGAILADVNKLAGKNGLMFGPDPASAERATIGGVIGNNAAGAHSIVYGMTADHLYQARVIQSDGSSAVWSIDTPTLGSGTMPELISFAKKIKSTHGESIKKIGPRTWRNSAGYRLNYLLPTAPSKPPQWRGAYPGGSPSEINIVALLAGSEGSLGVIASATLKLVRKPLFKVLGIIAYKSFSAASAAVPDLLALEPSAVELIPDNLIELARTVPAYADKVAIFTLPAKAYLVIEFSGDKLDELIKRTEAVPGVFAVASDPAAQERVWAARKVGLGLFDSASIKKRPIAFIEDCAIPVENLAKFVEALQERFEKEDVRAAYYAHASAGCLHIRPILDLRTGHGRSLLRSIAEFTRDVVVGLGGTMSSEHGDGRLRGEFIKDVYGEEVSALMRELKSIADPDRLFNPGKIIDPEPLDSGLRNAESTPSFTWDSALSFEPTGGLVNSIEKCNGQGVCRKSGGVMCPSFQVTGDELFSTRGRSNLLREYIYQKQNSDLITLEDLKKTLDLCLACKGCKAECPSRVDLAKLKAEFLNYYHQNHRPSLRDVLFANFPKILGFFSNARWLYNLVASLLDEAPIAKKFLGVAPERRLPRYQRSMVGRARKLSESSLTKVILLADVYTTYLEPEIGVKALLLLEEMGFSVIPIQVEGLGRTYLSKGFISEAKKQLLDAIMKIVAADPHGECPIIGLEPSELNILREEIYDLKVVENGLANAIANRAYYFDEFITRHPKEVEKVVVTSAGVDVLLHGHCHQKAATQLQDGLPIGVEATSEALKLFGYQVEILNTGCCGMAGAFGYEIEHYEFSNQAAELSLFPALRKQGNIGKLICAPGTSCRTQIKDGMSREGVHSVELAYARSKLATFLNQTT